MDGLRGRGKMVMHGWDKSDVGRASTDGQGRSGVVISGQEGV